MAANMRERACAEVAVPACLAAWVEGCGWHCDEIGEAGGAVYRLSSPGAPDRYLKHGQGDVAGDVIDEMVRLRWLNGSAGAPRVRHFVADAEAAWLLTDAVPGRTAHALLEDGADRQAIVEAIANHLRALHALQVDRCPFEAGPALQLAHARERLAMGLIDAEDFDGEREGWTAERVVAEVEALFPSMIDRVVTHGDYSLDNLLIGPDGSVGCIDVRRLGVADRWQDLAILWNGLRAFGEDLAWRAVARYGVERDARKLRFHLALDECF